MNPSNYCTYPWNSVLQNSESETIAENVMKILKRTGDTWRPLTWEEYSTERKKDCNFSPNEKKYFDEIIEYCQSPETARLFSKTWKNIKA